MDPRQSQPAEEQSSSGDPSDPSNNRRIAMPAPDPSGWAKPADLAHVRAQTPLGVAHGAGHPTPHVIEPVKKPNRSKSDASSKSASGVFKRMFGGGLTNANNTPVVDKGSDPSNGVSDLHNSFGALALSPPTNGSSSHPPHRQNSLTPASSSDYQDSDLQRTPSAGARPTNGTSAAPRAPSRASSVHEHSGPNGAHAAAAPGNHERSSRKPPSRAPSTDGRDRDEHHTKGTGGASDKHGPGQRFTLKELLGSGSTKLVRKSSASSRRSDSSRGDRDDVAFNGGYVSGGETGPKARSSKAPSSAGGESTTSLLKKYGVCERAAIGKGATSVVRLAHKWDRSEEKLYAVKEFRKRRKNETEREYVKKLTAEFCISSTLHHMNIVETVDLVQDENQHWCEVMEYCPGGDLYAAIKRGGMSPSEVECSFKQILLGVQYLHGQGVAHRDIKPENLFFDARGILKIGDYGASTVYRLPWETSIHMSTGLCGSEPYIAPEQFMNHPYDARLVDIWACGIVYYCLHFQELPWRVAQLSDNLYASYVTACNSKNKAEAECPPTINNLSPRACRPILRKMLEPDPKKRVLVDDVLQDPWMKGIEVCSLVEKPTHVHVHVRQMTSDIASWK
ncbi:serine/threonine-protein kinase HAL4/sat4 [Tulasnella sp. 418]|nr:serine/threonine-protein kinase HAL4/sat4 [Tulasnella sp. 418]